MKTPIRKFDPYTTATALHSLRSLRTIARRIKTRASNAVGHVGRLLLFLMLLPVSLLITFAAVACDHDAQRERIAMPRQDATTRASDDGANGDGSRHE